MLSVCLINPKFSRNVGATYRACAAFGAEKLYVTGNRWEATVRLPREERMRVYKDKVDLIRTERPFEAAFHDNELDNERLVPVAIEVSPTAEPLAFFDHPANALYVFGPEDGGVPRVARRFCHRFVILPGDHCLNLAAAVSCVLMHRRVQRQLLGLEPVRAAYDTIREEERWYPGGDGR